MRNGRKYLAVLLCLIMAVAAAGCGSTSAGAGGKNSDGSKVVKAVSSLEKAAVGTGKYVQVKSREAKKKAEKKARAEKAKAAAAEKETAASSTGNNDTGTASSGSQDRAGAKKSGNTKPSGHVLTIEKGSSVKYYTESDLKKMGTESYRYSFRNKDSSHRQFDTWSGVKLSVLLKKTGFSGSTLRVTASDGYTKEYSISDLESSKWAFRKTTGSSGSEVPAIISTSGSDAYRLCFGQSRDDTDDSGDYNMQYWAKYIVTIVVE